ARVRDRDEVDPREAGQHARVVAPQHAQADEAGPEVRHQAPAVARTLTASTIRSRSPWVSDGCTGSDRHSAAALAVSGRSISTEPCAPPPRDPPLKGTSSWFGTG